MDRAQPAARRTVPQIFIDGRHVGGSDQLAELDRVGELDRSARTDRQRRTGMSAFTVACVQTNSARDIEPNIVTVGAIWSGGRATPAPTSCCCRKTSPCWSRITPAAEGKGGAGGGAPGARRPSADLAPETGVWLLIGSLAIAVEGGRVANRSLLVDPAGTVVARYDKIHLFDVDLGGGESYREFGDHRARRPRRARRYAVGRARDERLLRPSLPASLPASGPGRRRLSRHSGGVHPHHRPRPLARPAAGARHRERLLRFRTGAVRRARRGPRDLRSLADRRSLGRGAGRCGEDVGFIVADIDPAEVAAARRRIPSLDHDRPFA